MLACVLEQAFWIRVQLGLGSVLAPTRPETDVCSRGETSLDTHLVQIVCEF